MPGPLDGVLVVDFARLYPGPFCAAVLGALGARVVKVEDPRAGDPTRRLPPEGPDGEGFAFRVVNAGKESLAVDTRRPEGAEVVRRLAARADLLVEGFRPGTLARVGLGPDDLRRANPRLVVLSLVGYAPDDPAGDRPGHDLNYQSLAGLVDPRGPPRAQVADVAGALYGAVAALAALRERDRTGRGSHVTVALADAALAAAALPLARALFDGGDELAGDLPAYNTYRCADGRHLALGALEPKFWESFCRAAEREDLLDAGFAVGDAVAKARVAGALAERPRAAWLDLCAKAGVPATPVLAPAEAAPAARRRGPAAGLGLDERRAAPRLGAHTEAWLAELGYGPDERAELRRDGLVGAD